MTEKTQNILRWIAVLPGALIAGMLSTFPFHWILYLTLQGRTSWLGLIELSEPFNIDRLEYLLYPLVIAFFFLLAGYSIAPKFKFKTSIVLGFLYVLFQAGVVFMAVQKGVEVEIGVRALGPIVGVLLGLAYLWQGSKKDPTCLKDRIVCKNS